MSEGKDTMKAERIDQLRESFAAAINRASERHMRDVKQAAEEYAARSAAVAAIVHQQKDERVRPEADHDARMKEIGAKSQHSQRKQEDEKAHWQQQISIGSQERKSKQMPAREEVKAPCEHYAKSAERRLCKPDNQ